MECERKRDCHYSGGRGHPPRHHRQHANAGSQPEALGGRRYPSWDTPAEMLRNRGAEIPSYWNYEGGEALGVERNRELIQIVVKGDQGEKLMPLLSEIDVEIT